ncbi:MAG: peptide chain release factor N(5)-glutamine methyltransferase [Bacteroidota bacterium]|nr:peptide chain release factor N(5)-glutamine methyltransferase [Candidatus Kapabacteria bacterium]MDW8220668.1 peptide chain release factor N(5)-glutamine methyltransferase [Bacteroidota bacterium]
MEKVWTILEIINWGKQYFAQRGIDAPRLTIELFLAHVLGISRVQLYMHFDRPLRKEELSRLRIMIQRRVAREPLQYIIGEVEFAGLKLLVNPAVFIPRPETELLVEYAIRRISSEGAAKLHILDIGTGSGCIALAIAQQFPHVQVHALDSSAESLGVAQKNALLHGICNVQFEHSDILTAHPERRFDVILSNPPYISQNDMNELEPEIYQYEPHSALTDGADGLRFYQRFAEIFPVLLEQHGWFVVEIGFNQSDAVSSLFTGVGYVVSMHKDLAGINRVCVGQK